MHKENQFSKTLKIFTVLVSGTVTPVTVTSSTYGSDRCLAMLPTTIASVLFGFRQPVGVQPAMDGLETAVDDAECLASAESDV